MKDTEGCFIETIRWSEGRYHLLDLHSRRMAETLEEMKFPQMPPLRELLPCVPERLRNLTVKCRVLYGGGGLERLEFEPYAVRRVSSLRMVEDNAVDYHLKFADRSRLMALRNHRREADEIIIVKNGLVTDTSYSNLLFRAPDGFLTPERPLLRGVMLRHLIAEGRVSQVALKPDDILSGNRYGITEAFMINAMMPPGISKGISIDDIEPVQ